VFAWALEADADAVEEAMAGAFAEAGVEARAYRAPVASEGVRVAGADETLVAA
jgi:homoserine kinase